MPSITAGWGCLVPSTLPAVRVFVWTARALLPLQPTAEGFPVRAHAGEVTPVVVDLVSIVPSRL